MTGSPPQLVARRTEAVRQGSAGWSRGLTPPPTPSGSVRLGWRPGLQPRRPSRFERVGLVVAFLLLVAGCNPVNNMRQQPRYEALEASTFVADGASARVPPANTVPRDAPPTVPAEVPVTVELLERGRERYGVYCTPCHGADGEGRGPVVQRGYPAPPSFAEPRLLRLSDSDMLRVVETGRGKMPPYGSLVPVTDRVAIIAYVRALQLSRAELERVSAEETAP